MSATSTHGSLSLTVSADADDSKFMDVHTVVIVSSVRAGS